ncbi:MAG TPA: HlyD family efflux transporter periplasmic adaptor subunit [Candidatus Polarisedimenticolaceae bacterium]|nr:HlyD family efflux transporter periplasmic adaptor subunit [Candidatus Polarisedimenticolaceae bacterium]
MRAPVLLATALALTACTHREPSSFQGYAEGEFVYVGSPVGGRLEKLDVTKGQNVEAGAPLFTLESVQEAAAVAQAEQNLHAARAKLADLGTGKRAPELAVTEAQLEQAQAKAAQSEAALARDTAQLQAGGIARKDLEATQAAHDTDAARVRELQEQLQVARLAARPEQIQAQSSEVAAAQAELDQAKWKLDQKRLAATKPGLVFDTLFREGEWVPAGSPVVRMLPPENVKVRFFVPETLVARFAAGQKLTVRCDGCASPIDAAVSYVSAEPEYTPPVIYSNETRSKMVFMIEARPSDPRKANLRPGQPVQVALP